MYVMILEDRIIVDKPSIEEAKECASRAREFLWARFKYNIENEFTPITNQPQLYSQVSEHTGVRVHRILYFNEAACHYEALVVPVVCLPRSGVVIRFDRDEPGKFERLKKTVESELGMRVDRIEVSYGFLKAVVGDDVYLYYPELGEWRKKPDKMYAIREDGKVIDVSDVMKIEDPDESYDMLRKKIYGE